MAQPFDLDRMALTAEAVAVANDVGVTTTAYAAFSASQTGVLAHREARPGFRANCGGSIDPANRRIVGTSAEYLDFELSPDERTVAVSRLDPKLSTADMWLLDLARNVPTRFTVDPERRQRDLVARRRQNCLQEQPSRKHRAISETVERNRAGTAQVDPEDNMISSDWSRDGKSIVYTLQRQRTDSTSGCGRRRRCETAARRADAAECHARPPFAQWAVDGLRVGRIW